MIISRKIVLQRLNTLDNWSLKKARLYKEVVFRDFKKAFSFMKKVAVVCEKYDHHPEWKNIYNKVVIQLCTHDLGGISEKDFFLAQKIDAILLKNRKDLVL